MSHSENVTFSINVKVRAKEEGAARNPELIAKDASHRLPNSGRVR
jgi:hypothetical protein